MPECLCSARFVVSNKQPAVSVTERGFLSLIILVILLVFVLPLYRDHIRCGALGLRLR